MTRYAKAAAAAILAALGASCAWTIIADAHRSATSRVHNARHVAQAQWGDVCDVGTMNIPISKMALGLGDVGLAQHDPDADGRPPYTGCRIYLTQQRWTSYELCRVIVHEIGHLAGREHSGDPRDIMFPSRPWPYGPCLRRRPPPDRGVPDAPPGGREGITGPPDRSPTVLLLPGGGFQNADPRTMDPWIHDLQRHGIRARAITYPLRDVPAAVEHVGRVADNIQGPVVAYGISAGGTIAAALGAQGRVDGAINLLGPTDFTRWIGPGAARIMRQIGMRTYAARRAASPYWMLNGRQSPQLVQCGLADPLVTYDQCHRYAQAAWRGNPDSTLQPTANAHGQWGWDRKAARDWITARWPPQPTPSSGGAQ